MQARHAFSVLVLGGVVAGSSIARAAGEAAARPASQPTTVAADLTPFILTPPPAPAPKIHGPRVYGERPGVPFFYRVPATGEKPVTFAAEGLPDGLSLDPKSGVIQGTVKAAGTHRVTVTATNARGSDTAPLDVVIGDTIALTPPMGWNSWNCWAGAVDQDKVLRAARAMQDSGLADHGWTYVNCDDTWQGKRAADAPHAIQADPKKFPDLKAMCDEIHGMGLKAGTYSTPWVASYARHIGGSATNPEGTYEPIPKGAKPNKNVLPFALGSTSFAAVDAKQYADWGFDYLKYDWNPVMPPETREMADALNRSGRDIVYSLSNNGDGSIRRSIEDTHGIANCWRTTGDIRDTWRSMRDNGFSTDAWAAYQSPGHWNDPDMLVVGLVGWGPKLHASRLKPDEQFTHVSLWCLLSAPLLIGCDLERMDPFTYSLLSNDEVLAIDQDALGKCATKVAQDGDVQVWAKPLADGSTAVGLFNLGATPAAAAAKWADVKVSGSQAVRDLWRQKDLGSFTDQFEATVPSHGVVLVRLTGGGK